MQISLWAMFAVAATCAVRFFVGPPLPPARRLEVWVLRGLVLLVLAAILANPIRSAHIPGSKERSHVALLVDTSSSMQLGQDSSRFEQAIDMIERVEERLSAEERPNIQTYRFGQQLAAIPTNHLKNIDVGDHDTQLLSALRQLMARFPGGKHHSVVLLSDGQVRDPLGVQEMARRNAEKGVPIHVVPLGNEDQGGDIAVVNMVMPPRVRKFAQVGVTVWVRSYGYDGLRSELVLENVDRSNGAVRHPLARLPIMLTSGVESYSLSFRSEAESMHVRASVKPRNDEISSENNSVAMDVDVDRTKIRVLYLDGTRQGLLQRVLQGGSIATTGAYRTLYDALMEDPDIECVPLLATSGSSSLHSVMGEVRSIPTSRANLYAYDAMIMSDVDRSQLTEQQMELIDDWVSERGAGFCMVGGPNSFSDGQWADTMIADLLPVTLPTTGTRTWNSAQPYQAQLAANASRHPLWSIVSDSRENQQILQSLPLFRAVHEDLAPKQSGQVLLHGRATDQRRDPIPLAVVGPYGKGRTMAAAVSANAQWSPEFALRWGKGDNRYYSKFWRNVVYWLSENSYLGRRRMSVTSDRLSYRPGDTIKLTTRVLDEIATPTTKCRVTVMVEPQSFDADIESDYAPVCWPNGLERPEPADSPYVMWGEELEMLAYADRQCYELELPIAERLSGNAGAEALRAELSAYEDYTLIDSTSIDIQVLDDPFEHRNPLPNGELLRQIADATGGQLFRNSESLARMLAGLPVVVGPDEVRKTPLWSQWWLLVVLLVLLSVEWGRRRQLGMA